MTICLLPANLSVPYFGMNRIYFFSDIYVVYIPEIEPVSGTNL